MVVLLAAGVVLALFQSWRLDRLAELAGVGGVIRTALSPVGVLVSGEGPAVLVFRGSPGGYDQAMALGFGLIEGGFQTIAPSRPAFFRTLLQTGIAPSRQADAMAILIGNLDIESVAVVGLLSGAPEAVEFVARHLNRVWALVLESPLTAWLEPRKKAETVMFASPSA